MMASSACNSEAVTSNASSLPHIRALARPPPIALARTRQETCARLASELSGIGAPNPRYTIAKFRDYSYYCDTTSSWRCLAVIVLSPLPSILTTTILPLIPLQDPTRGLTHNTGYILNFFVTMGLVMFGSIFQLRGPMRLTARELPLWRLLLIAVLGSLQLTAISIVVGFVWRYPVPFVWMVFFPPFLVLLALNHVIVLGRSLRENASLRQQLVAFVPSYLAQGTQIVVYPAFSSLFEISSNHVQIFLSLCFPVIKHFFRRLVFAATFYFPHDAELIAVGSVEICSVMYQTMIMQSTPSPAASAVLMGVDIVQGLLSVYVLMNTPSHVPRRQLITKARSVLYVESPTIDDKELDQYATRMLVSTAPWQRHRLSAVVPSPLRGARGVAIHTKKSRPMKSKHRSEREIVTHALETIQDSESLALTEYFEVLMPIASVIYTVWASSFRTAIYNPKIRSYYESADHLSVALSSLMVYTLLQASSLVFLQAILWHRYRVSAMKLLAFALERHAWAMQGLLITWLIINFQFPVVHYGVDFTFKFDYTSYSSCVNPPCK